MRDEIVIPYHKGYTVLQLDSSGADVNHSSADGLTPLMLTAASGSTTALQVLLGARANLEVKDPALAKKLDSQGSDVSRFRTF